jgi:hypothetical protein
MVSRTATVQPKLVLRCIHTLLDRKQGRLLSDNAGLKGSEMSETSDLQPWLKEQCGRLMYGQCTTARCLKRGGYKGPEDYDAAVARATCEPYELSQLLAERDTARSELAVAQARIEELITRKRPIKLRNRRG